MPSHKHVFALLLSLSAWGASAAPVTTFSTSAISGAGAQSDLQLDGTATFVATAGTESEFGFRQLTYDASASANLGTGSLKLKNSFSAVPGPNYPSFTSGPGSVLSYSFVSTGFGDSFRTKTGTGDIFDWSGKTASFTIDLTGNRTEQGFNIPQTSAAYNTPGSSYDRISTWFYFTAYEPGTLDLVYQAQTFDWANGSIDEYFALSNQIFSNTIYRSPCTAITNPGWGDGEICDVLGLPGQFSVQFSPEGDFDWFISMASDITVDWATPSASATMDLSHTAVVSYQAPQGAVTYSGSGVFPGTLAAEGPSNEVPEPTTLALLGIGLASLALKRRRKH